MKLLIAGCQQQLMSNHLDLWKWGLHDISSIFKFSWVNLPLGIAMIYSCTLSLNKDDYCVNGVIEYIVVSIKMQQLYIFMTDNLLLVYLNIDIHLALSQYHREQIVAY